MIRFLPNYKRFVIISIAFGVWTTWLIVLSPASAFSHFFSNWQVALTMVFGSTVAGATSLGGGAVAFPVLTKLLHVASHDAKVFSLAIQSVGMGAATAAICLTRIKVEWKVVLWGSLGGILGIWLGLGLFAPFLPPDVLKMSFTFMLASFGITLLALNRVERECHSQIPVWRMQEKLIVFGAGLLGGIMSGLVGNGIDIFAFAAMVLLFRMSEKVATPTSVILMAFNAMVGLTLQVFIFHDFTTVVQSYWFAAIPVVVVGAPFGAMLCSRMSRQTIANILISLVGIELITSLLLIPLTLKVVSSSVAMLLICSYLNYLMYRNQSYELLPIQQNLGYENYK